MAIKVLFEDNLHRHTLLAELPGVYTDNPENYFRDKEDDNKLKLRVDRRPLPSAVPIHKGLRLYLTANKDKENDFVNGMEVTVETYSQGCLTVWTTTGIRLPVYRITENFNVQKPGEEDSVVRVSYFPIRLGYASTIDKVQGATLGHITLWLDVIRKAAGHVGLSRVEYDNRYLIGGDVTPEHFLPGDGI